MPRLPRIPDILTTANLSCGVASILLASQGQLTLACWLVFAGAAFDVLDGWAARALGGGSEFGKQLDSLADMVTFGVAPGIIAAIDPMLARQHELSCHREVIEPAFAPFLGQHYGIAITIALLIVTASCWRLAKFNIDTRQSNGFLGLATPANAMFWASIGVASTVHMNNIGPLSDNLASLLSLLAGDQSAKLLTAFVLGVLMLSSIPLPSLKFKHMKWKGNEVIYCLLAIGICLLLLYGILAVPLILLLYLLSPLWGKLFPKTQ
ncbi:MAG: CDP-alcohol phosphatidyltransferase family protein [Flavobacteriales bacterium]|nr:CDP-alcohol phosphatidyltransferase family protein [Flavobacteriales bacterium]